VAGRRLFAEQGYQATTQKQIAASAGVSTSVLFRNFGSKSQLLLEAVIEPFGEFAGDLGTAYGASGAGSGRSLAREFVADLIDRLLPHRDTLRSLLTTLHSPDGDPLMAEMGARMDALVAELTGLVGGFGAGPIGGPRDERAELDVRLVVGMVTTMTVLDDWLLPTGIAVRDERIVEVLASMVSFGPDRERTATSGRVRLRSSVSGRSAPNGTPDESAERADEPTRRNSEEVRSALLAAATRLFAEHGYGGTGYREIAVAAGTSESVLYRHFGSKSNLLAEAVLRPFTDSFEAAGRAWAQIAPDARQARQPQVIGTLYATFVANRHLVRVLMGLAHDPQHEDLNSLTADWFARTFATMGALSQERARAERIIPYEPELRIRAVVAMVMAAGTLDDWFLLRGGKAFGAAQVAVAMSDLIDLGRDSPRSSRES